MDSQLPVTFGNPAVDALDQEVRRAGRVGAALGLLGWDQETYMPRGGAAARATTIGEITQVVHEMVTSSRFGDCLQRAEEALTENDSDAARALVRLARRDYDRRRDVPAALAERIARCSSAGQEAWKGARAADDFSLFAPSLEELVALKKEEGEVRGVDHLYGALLDDYEPHCTPQRVTELCDEVRPILVDLTREYSEKSAALEATFLSQLDESAQRRFSQRVVEDLGFDLQRGRIDESTHPFCSGLNPGDVRLTTRYSRGFEEAFFGLIHETGHGLYEQGLDVSWSGTALGSAVSMAIHESQSRLWENIVARSRPFWEHYLPLARQHFPQLDGVEVDTLTRVVNRVRPSLIRVEADEVTYNLHVMLRFEIEQALFSDQVKVEELPQVWNERMQQTLGVTPTTAADGVLQDIHWSFGAFGYFPTYFLGNLYASQFFGAAEKKLGDLEGAFAKGEFQPLRQWLGSEIHRHGGCYPAEELCQRVTGSPLSAQPFCDYLRRKLRQIHG